MSSKKSKTSKRLSSSDSDSGPEDRNPPPKRAKTDTKKSSGGGGGGGGGKDRGGSDETMFKLSKMRYASVTEFRGKVLVNIREYFDSDGELKPTKKGISLSVEQWEALKSHIDSIDEAVKNF